MFKRIGKEYENKGATLVLVIVCMLFVGIIAAAILTLTTGNINTVKTGEGSSDNFYSAESVIDDIKVYFQKIANSAATEAYAKMLDEVAAAPGIDKEATYKKHYKEILKEKIEDELDESNDTGIKSIIKNKSYASLGVEDGIYKTMSLQIAGSTLQDDLTLQGIKLVFTDNGDYTTTIDTDIQFDCKMPPMSKLASEDPYAYDVDKFIIISEGGIKSGTGMTGDITGSLYSGSDIEFKIGSSTEGSGVVNVNSQYIISKGDVVVENGKLNISGLGNGTNEKQFLDLKRNPESKAAENKDEYKDANLWVNGIELKSGKPEVKIDDTDAKVYVKDDLSLNAADSKFTMTHGDYWGFSSDNTTAGTVSAHRPSSALVINGVNSVLDMSGMNSLVLAGTAYTQVPAIAGYTAADDCMYFVQGESVTYKSLQSAYLVPSEYIEMTGLTGGYNPIPASDWSKFTGVKTADIANMGVNVEGLGYRYATVKYVNSADAQVYYYIYWDFASVGDAVKYFNTMYNKNEDLLKSKIGMIGTGSISLPSTVYSKGDLITCSGATAASKTLGHVSSKWTGTDNKASECAEKELSYGRYTSGLSDETHVSSDLFDNLFRNGNLSMASGEQKERTLEGPQAWATEDHSYTGYVLGADGLNAGKSWSYKLITGDNVVLNGLSTDTKYVVICGGDVSVSGNFNGIIIAKGKVTVGSGANMTCFGNFCNTITSKTDATDSRTEYISEFDALLNVTVNGDADLENGNTILRNIFGVAGYTSAGAGDSGKASDIASVGTVNYKKN